MLFILSAISLKSPMIPTVINLPISIPIMIIMKYTVVGTYTIYISRDM